MKKLMTGIAAIALIATSCAKNEVENTNSNPNTIGFELSTGKTRATTVTIGGLQSDANGFGVYAENGAAPAKFIDNETYKYVSSAWKWGGSDIMWPTTDAGYPVNFYAYYPKSETSLTNALDYTYTIKATTALQVDLLAAKQLNVVSRPASSNVSLNFKHILSKIDFKVVTGATITAEVQSIAIKHVGDQGTYNFALSAWTSTPRATNSSFSSNYDYMVAPVIAANVFANQTTPKAVTGSAGSMMLMPQELKNQAWDKQVSTIATKSYIEVVYRLYETATGKDIVGMADATKHPDYATKGNGETGALFVKVGFPLPTLWITGKAYTYTIYLGTPDSSGGNLTDGNYIEDKGKDTGLPIIIDGEKKDKPDPIFNDKPIGFIVSVDNWDDQPGIDVK